MVQQIDDIFQIMAGKKVSFAATKESFHFGTEKIGGRKNIYAGGRVQVHFYLLADSFFIPTIGCDKKLCK